MRRFLRRLTRSVFPDNADSELNREIHAHLQLLEGQFIAKGMTPEEARYAAKRAFGGVEQTKELQRDARRFQWLSGWKMDLKLGIRMLAKSPGLTVIAVIALAVAIGVGVAYLEFVNDFFRPRLTFAGGDRLVGLVNYDLTQGRAEMRALSEFAAWKAHLTTVEDLGVSRPIEANLIIDDGAEFVRGVEVSASAFRLVPIAPLMGRPLIDDDEKPGAPGVLVIGQDVWKSRFRNDPNVIGQTVRFNDSVHTIVGVMPRSFGFPMSSNLWTAVSVSPAALKSGEGPPVRIFGRLKTGITLDKAQAELESIGTVAGKRPVIKPYVESLWSSGDSMWEVIALYSFNVFFIALLGICAANVATLVFARTATRESELTVRTALGASRGRIVSQLVAESFVLTAVAAAVGLAGAAYGLRQIRYVWETAQGSSLPFWWNEQLGTETLLYAGLLVILAALMIGGVPALKATGGQMHDRLKAAGSTGSMRFGKLWTGVIVMQVAVTVLFLMALVSLGWGILEQNQAIAETAFPANEYFTARLALEEVVSRERIKEVYNELHRRMSEDPSVISAALAIHLPGHGYQYYPEFPSRTLEDNVRVHGAAIGKNYFETFRQPLIAGRPFTLNEIETEAKVAIVDETFVREMLGGGNAIGQMVRDKKFDEGWREIIGVVKDLSVGPKKTARDATLYMPVAAAGEYSMRIILHTRSADAGARVRAAGVAVDPQMRFTDVNTVEKLASAEAQTLRFFTSALGIVAAVALMLSTAGIYSLISFTLSRRTREIGIRTALGAAPLRIVTGILSRAFLQVGLGLAIGCIPGALLIKSGTEASSGLNSGVTFGATIGVALFVLLVALLSCIPPVRRALGVQPMEALRIT